MAAAAIFGLIIGSFLNVVIHRVPRGESVVSPPSACPKCAHRLSAWENVPVLSFLLLRGRCRSCGEPISWRYPAVELLGGIAFAAIAVRYPRPLLLVALCVFSAVLIAEAAIDLDTRKLPRHIIYFGTPLSLIFFVAEALRLRDARMVEDALIGGILAGAVFGLIHLVAPRSMGFGDVRFAAYIGINLGFLGIAPVVNFLYGAFILGGLFGVAYALLKSKTLKVAIPFGPFMAMAAFLAALLAGLIQAL
ncbi:MAG: prepilin peptidase [Actinomycetota bacterium]|nr:prepilin peptidase [Actinomycetota bacterium]